MEPSSTTVWLAIDASFVSVIEYVAAIIKAVAAEFITALKLELDHPKYLNDEASYYFNEDEANAASEFT